VKIKKIAYTLSLVLVSSIALSQGIRGTITTQNNKPLPFATIYIRNLETGTTSNDLGIFEYHLSPGKYDLIFQYLGYETVLKLVDVGAAFVELNIRLKPQAIVLKGVEVRAGKEDPAYTIMRKTIAKADFHRQQLDRSVSEVYIKGSGRLIDAPFFLRKAIAKEGVDSTTAFVTESISEITYTRPNQYDERVISVRSIGEDNNTSPQQFISGSFYEPKIANAISPLSPKAFGYYKFEYLGTFRDRGFEISKIGVIPRSKGDDLFQGEIFIVEEFWSIYSIDLQTSYYGIIFDIKQIYDPIENKVWMPVSHQFHIEGTFFGFEFEYDYLATISKYDITLNPDLEVSFVVIDEKADKELAAKLEADNKNVPDETIDKITSGKELTRKELRKLLREYEKQEAKSDTLSDVIAITTFKVDSLAHKKDTTYWNQVRPVPLSTYEIKGYHKMDSMAVVAKKESEGDTIKSKKNRRKGFHIEDIIIGDTYKIGERTHLELASPLLNIRFNTVEGYNFYYQVNFTKTFKNKNWLEISPFARYAFSREILTGKLRTTYQFGPATQRKSIQLEGGKYVSQINPQAPIHDILNSFTTLLLKGNYMKLYEDEYLQLSYADKISDKFRFTVEAKYTSRLPLENTTDHTWIKNENKDYTSNAPANAELADTSFEPNQAFLTTLKVKFRPLLKFKIRNDRKSAINGSSPEISITYTNGLPIGPTEIDFHRLQMEVKHAVEFGIRGKLNFNIGAGTFLSKQNISFLDFNHFMGNLTPFQVTDPVGSYRLLDYYFYSIDGAYFTLLTHFQFRKLFLSRFGFVRKRGIRESVIINYLGTSQSKNYTELGYSIDNIFRVFRIETIAVFQEAAYVDWGIRVGIAVNLDEMFDFE